jgi:hypothetical protein
MQLTETGSTVDHPFSSTTTSSSNNSSTAQLSTTTVTAVHFDSQIFSSNHLGSLSLGASHSNATTSSSYYFHLPVQIFEALHLHAYNTEFLKTYVRISLKLEIENIAATQYRREAFSNDEITVGEKILAVAGSYQKRLEEMWRESRWIVEWINVAREKPSSIQHQHCSLYFIRTTDLRQFIEQLTSKTIQFTFRCETCKSVINSVHLNYGDGNWKRNFNEQLARLPINSSVCHCTSTRSGGSNALGYTLSHIDSVLGDDYGGSGEFSSGDLSRLNSVHDFIDNDDSVQASRLNLNENKTLNSAHDTSNSNVNNKKGDLVTLVSKMFISKPTAAVAEGTRKQGEF